MIGIILISSTMYTLEKAINVPKESLLRAASDKEMEILKEVRIYDLAIPP